MCNIRGALHAYFPGFSGFRISQETLCTQKNQQGHRQGSERNGRTVFFAGDLVFCTHQ